MQKLLLFPVLLYLGCVMSGVYGALHNQISYTVSPEFFDRFLFPQFETPEELRNRVGASIVGWQASWWMGLIIGPPILLVGLIIPGRKAYWTRCLCAFGLVAATTLIVGLAALAHANSRIPEHLSIERAGTMHDFSYLGGMIGIITASAFLLVERVRLGWAMQKQSETTVVRQTNSPEPPP